MTKIFVCGFIFVFLLDYGWVFACNALECTPYRNRTIVDKLLASVQSQENSRNVKFYLFTRKNAECFQELKLNDTGRLRLSNFSPYWPTRIIIHGWRNNLFSHMNGLITAAYLKKGNFNVIILDWSSTALKVDFYRTTKLIFEVGRDLADFALFLHNVASVSFSHIYLIGHDLGVYIAGSAGIQSRMKFNTIFGLDPAEANYSMVRATSALFAAKYVESIQTDMGLLGINYSIGHASFFPNYGNSQKGCNIYSSCSHTRAYVYFAESIKTDLGFWGAPCKSMKEIYERKCTARGKKQLMGGEPSARKRGFFYLPTNSETSYATGLNVRTYFYG